VKIRTAKKICYCKGSLRQHLYGRKKNRVASIAGLKRGNNIPQQISLKPDRLLVLIVIAVSPVLVARLRGLAP